MQRFKNDKFFCLSKTLMKNMFKEILQNQFNITDINNFDFKFLRGRKISNKNVRGSVRSQLGKFIPDNQFDQNKRTIENNPLP